MTAIKVHEKIYELKLKWGNTLYMPEQAWVALAKKLMKWDSSFVQVWNQIINRFEVVMLQEKEVATDVEAYIIQQPKAMRDKIEEYAKSAWITRKSIDHVSNFIQANSDA